MTTVGPEAIGYDHYIERQLKSVAEGVTDEVRRAMLIEFSGSCFPWQRTRHAKSTNTDACSSFSASQITSTETGRDRDYFAWLARATCCTGN